MITTCTCTPSYCTAPRSVSTGSTMYPALTIYLYYVVLLFKHMKHASVVWWIPSWIIIWCRACIKVNATDHYDARTLYQSWLCYLQWTTDDWALHALNDLFCWCLQNDSELFGKTVRVNLAKPMKIKEGSSRPGNSTHYSVLPKTHKSAHDLKWDKTRFFKKYAKLTLNM